MYHVVVYRRECIGGELKYLNNVKIKDKKLLNLVSLAGGPVKDDMFKGLYWRVHNDGVHKKFSEKDNPEEWKNRVLDYQRKLLS